MPLVRSQDGTAARNNRRSNSPTSVKEELNEGPALDAGRSSLTAAGFTQHSLFDAASHDELSQPQNKELLACKQSPRQPDFSSEQMLAGNESSSQTFNVTLFEHLPEADVGRNRDGTGYWKANDRENNAGPDLSNMPGMRDRHVPGGQAYLQDRNQLAQSQQNAVQKQQQENPANSISIGIEYNTNHNKSKAGPGISHSRRYSTSSPSEQQSETVSECILPEEPSEQAVRITRPRDYIRQWKDSISRLSTVSVTDKFGAPISPLISHYTISPPGRSKSLDAKTKLDNHYPLTFRSRSSHALSTVDAGAQNYPNHTSNTSQVQTPVETVTIKSSKRTISHDVGPTGIHRRQHQETPHFSVYTRELEYPVVKETKLGRGSTYTTVPPVTLMSHKAQPHVLGNTNEQTILKYRFRSEPPSPGSMSQFQQQKHAMSNYVHRSQPADGERHSPGTPASATSHRHRSLSPQRHTVGSRAHSVAGLPTATVSWQPHPMFSASRRYRSPSPQQLRSTTDVRKQEGIGGNIHVSVASSEVSPASFVQLTEATAPPTNHGLNVRVAVDYDRLSMIGSVPDCPGVGLAEDSEMIHTLSFRAHAERQTGHHLTEGSSNSPPAIGRRGAGRVPRKEAWEQDRRHRNLDSPADWKQDRRHRNLDSPADSGSAIVDVLFEEIEIMREKIELLERDRCKAMFDLENRAGSARNTTQSTNSSTFRSLHCNNVQTLLSDRISGPACKSHNRASSCPLLKLSRRSKATRSVPRNAAQSGAARTETQPESRADKLGFRLPKSNFDTHCVSGPGKFRDHEQLDRQHRQNMDYSQTADSVKPYIYSGDHRRSLELRDLVRWKQLISRCDLSKCEIVELKQAVASALAENDILKEKLNNAREEVHDKLRHTNGVLEDCRLHLAKSQAENMQLRVMLEEEQRRSSRCGSMITDLESSIVQLQLQLEHSAMLLEESLTETRPGVEALKAENWRLASRLKSVEHKNDELREEVELLTHKQTKTLDTMDELRKCLARTREERQEPTDELATFKEYDHKNKVREIIKHCQEKGIQDEWEKEQSWAGETQRSSVSHAGVGSQMTRDLYSRPSDGGPPRRLSKFPNSPTVHDRGEQQYNRSCEDPETYPHRKGHMKFSRRCSPHQEGRSSSLPGYFHPLSVEESSIGSDFSKTQQCIQSRKTLVHSDIQASQPRSHRSRSPGRSRSPMPGSFSPRHRHASSPLKSGNSDPCSVDYRLNRSLTSPEHFTYVLSQYTPHLDTTRDNRRDRPVAESRSKSPDYDQPGFSIRNSGNATAGWHTPPTRLSPGHKERSHTTNNKRRPLHSKTEAGEIAKKLQEEFDQEDHMITLISKCSPRKPWVEKFRKRAPVLTKEQQQYADQLVQKYTGQISKKQPA